MIVEEDENGNGDEECGRCRPVITARQESELPEDELRALRIALDPLTRTKHANYAYAIKVVSKALAEHR